jgi:hypothetical protein
MKNRKFSRDIYVRCIKANRTTNVIHNVDNVIWDFRVYRPIYLRISCFFSGFQVLTQTMACSFTHLTWMSFPLLLSASSSECLVYCVAGSVAEVLEKSAACLCMV